MSSLVHDIFLLANVCSHVLGYINRPLLLHVLLYFHVDVFMIDVDLN